MNFVRNIQQRSSDGPWVRASMKTPSSESPVGPMTTRFIMAEQAAGKESGNGVKTADHLEQELARQSKRMEQELTKRTKKEKKEEESRRKKEEEAAKKARKEEEKKRKSLEVDKSRNSVEDEKKKAVEEVFTKTKKEDEALKKKKEDEALKKKKEEEALKKKKQDDVLKKKKKEEKVPVKKEDEKKKADEKISANDKSTSKTTKIVNKGMFYSLYLSLLQYELHRLQPSYIMRDCGHGKHFGIICQVGYHFGGIRQRLKNE